jgi:hypothetical protein
MKSDKCTMYGIFGRKIQHSFLVVRRLNPYQKGVFSFFFLFLWIFSWLSLTCSFIFCLFFTSYYYELTQKIGWKGQNLRLRVKRWDGGKETRGKACENGWNSCDSRRKVWTVGHLGEVTGRAPPPRCPTVETFRLPSHGFQPFSHAFPLVSLPPSHFFTLKRKFRPSQPIFWVSS